MAVNVYKVTEYWTIAPGEKYKSSREPLSGHSIFINGVHKPVLCAFLFRDTALLNTVDLLALNSVANSTITHAWMKLSKNFFLSVRDIMASHLRTLGST